MLVDDDAAHLGRQRGGEPLRRCEARVLQRGEEALEHARGGAGEAVLRGDAAEQAHALLEHEVDVDAGVDLDLGVVRPRAVRVGPALDAEAPLALGVGRDAPLEAVESGGDVDHARGRVHAAVRAQQHRRRSDGVVPLTEHGRADGDGLADGGLRGPSALLERRADVEHGDAADRCRQDRHGDVLGDGGHDGGDRTVRAADLGRDGHGRGRRDLLAGGGGAGRGSGATFLAHWTNLSSTRAEPHQHARAARAGTGASAPVMGPSTHTSGCSAARAPGRPRRPGSAARRGSPTCCPRRAPTSRRPAG